MYWLSGARLGVLLVAWGMATSCHPINTIDDSTVFRYNEAAGINSLDPAFARNQANNWAVNQLFDGLVQLDEHLQVQPAIARSWQIGDSGRTYRFLLRKDVYFHRDSCFGSAGTRPVVAADFLYSFERLRSRKLAAPGAWVFQNVAHFAAPSDSVFEIQLQKPFPAFLSLLSMQYCAVVPREAVKKYGANFREQPVGAGPFQFKLWLPNEKLVLRRNPMYYKNDSAGNSLPYLEAVAISFIPDKQSAFLEFIKGQLDFLSGLDPSYKDELLTFDGALRQSYRSQIVMQRQPFLNTEYLGIMVDTAAYDNHHHPLLHKEVRQAINYGFNRRGMMRYLRSNVGYPAQQGFVPRGLPAYDSAAAYGYRYLPDTARQLLARAGYPQGKGMPEIKLLTNASYLDLCEYIQSDLQKLGIPVQVEVTTPSTLREAKANGKAYFFRASWIADYPDAENYLSLFYSKNKAPFGPNYTHFSHPLYDQWYKQAFSANDPLRRKKLYRKMDSLVMREAPVVPLYYDQVLRFFQPNVKGLRSNALNLLDLTRVRKEALSAD